MNTNISHPPQMILKTIECQFVNIGFCRTFFSFFFGNIFNYPVQLLLSLEPLIFSKRIKIIRVFLLLEVSNILFIGCLFKNSFDSIEQLSCQVVSISISICDGLKLNKILITWLFGVRFCRGFFILLLHPSLRVYFSYPSGRK